MLKVLFLAYPKKFRHTFFACILWIFSSARNGTSVHKNQYVCHIIIRKSSQNCTRTRLLSTRGLSNIITLFHLHHKVAPQARHWPVVQAANSSRLRGRPGAGRGRRVGGIFHQYLNISSISSTLFTISSREKYLRSLVIYQFNLSTQRVCNL